MEAVTDRAEGLFPKPREITMRCSCPDHAGMCKHIAAVMYGIGNRLDASPELLFALRGVDHSELIEQAIPVAPVAAKTGAPAIEASELGAIFDIEIDAAPALATASPATKAAAKQAPKAKKVAAPKKSAAPKGKKAAAAKKPAAPKKRVAAVS